jgi:hypothetical protein
LEEWIGSWDEGGGGSTADTFATFAPSEHFCDAVIPDGANSETDQAGGVPFGAESAGGVGHS